MRIEDHLRSTAERFPGKTALVAGGRRLSYAELDIQSDRLAAAFAATGLQPGDRVVLFIENGWEAVIGLFAILKAGAVAVPLNPLTKPEKLAQILNNVDPRAIISHSRHVPVVDAVFGSAEGKVHRIAVLDHPEERPEGWCDLQSLLSERSIPFRRDAGDDNDLALLIHTSGSTGRPKGVMLSHANVLWACEAIVAYLENTSDDVILSVLPLSFGYGLTQLVTAVICGATLVLEKSFAYPQLILRRMAEEQATGFPLVPTMAAMLLQKRDLAPELLPSLRYISSAAAQLPPTLSSGLAQRFPAAQLYIMYGQTECLRAAWLPPVDLRRKPTSVGQAIAGSEVAVVDGEGNPLPPGDVGELVVRGPHVMQGYWRDTDATAAALRPSAQPWGRELRTGDLFRMDETGFLYFVARRDDIIKCRGEKVSPQEVERVLHALDGVREVAVAGIADPILGEAVKAVIVREVDSAIEVKHVLRHCARHLEDYMVPKWVEFRDSLPRTDSGKIRLDRREEELTGESA